MIYLNAVFSHALEPEQLPVAVRAALGKPLRRAAALTQLAVIGAIQCIPPERRHLPTLLLWQTTSGPRAETLNLLEEICLGSAEPMPYDFLASQPTLAAAQLSAVLPGLQSASHLPLDDEHSAQWSLLLSLAQGCLDEGRYAQVLCAHLDSWPDVASGHWLSLSGEPLENSLASLQLVKDSTLPSLSDQADFPRQLAQSLQQHRRPTLAVHSPGRPRLALEFARL